MAHFNFSHGIEIPVKFEITQHTMATEGVVGTPGTVSVLKKVAGYCHPN